MKRTLSLLLTFALLLTLAACGSTAGQAGTGSNPMLDGDTPVSTTTELMVSVSGALAQQESVSISQNLRTSYHRRMERGEFITTKEVIEALRQTANLIHNGPERLESFDEALFADLTEKIIVESQTRIRFRLYGGFELTESLREVGR